MWLLSTDRAELHYFARSFDADGGYAILSHTWGEDEQTFQQVRAIAERCRVNGTNPREDPALSSKIRHCCILAETHGYRWVWIDSCCIDKTSSSELSEAINSMYKWYKASEVCFAYLKDVPSDDVLDAPDSAFRRSRWHTRGWTLQELIAPDSVIFLSVDWRELGTRAGLAELLEAITRVPFRVLMGADVPAQFSACNRMFWASRRKTTRVEDEAYCLMGLFGVNMPTNYGEGKRAFIRLQNEIMQHNCDMSLFAFGACLSLEDIVRDGIALSSDGQVDRDNPWQYLLADSPRQFHHNFGYVPDLGLNAIQQYPPANSTMIGPFDGVELPHATATSYGVQFRLPVATIDGITLAVILCEASERHWGLFLMRDNSGRDPQRPRYFVGCAFTKSATESASYLARMCDLGDDLYHLTLHGKPVQASWRTIYVVPTTSQFVSENATSPTLFLNRDPASRFRVPRWLVDRFTAIQFEVDEMAYSETLQVVRFTHRFEGRIFVCLGTCTAAEHHDLRPDAPPPLWAKVFIMGFVNPAEMAHDCAEDHLDAEPWAARSKVFGDANLKVRLSFTRMPETTSTLAIHLELSGRIFQELLREAGTSLPSLEDLERNVPQRAILDAPTASSSPQSAPQPQVGWTAPRTPPCASTATLHRWFPTTPRNRPIRKRSVDGLPFSSAEAS